MTHSNVWHYSFVRVHTRTKTALLLLPMGNNFYSSDMTHHIWWWIMSRIWRSHVTTFIRVHTRAKSELLSLPMGIDFDLFWLIIYDERSHVTHMKESCHSIDCDSSYMTMSHVTHMKESCHTYEWVMSHIWRSHVTTFMYSCRIAQRSHVTTFMYSYHNTLSLNLGLQPSMCDMTHSYVWHDSFISVTWLIDVFDMTHTCIRTASHVLSTVTCSSWLVTWLIHVCDMTHSYVWHDSFICVTWLIRMCDVTYS